MKRLFAHLRPHLFTSHRRGTKRYFAHHDMPYPLDCAVLGHKPTWVDLMHGGGYFECSRCTRRPALTDTAKRWTGPAEPKARIERALAEGEIYWPTRRADSHLEIASRYVDRFAVEISIGNAGSETPLDAHLIIPKWRGFYVGTSVIGNRIAHWRSRRATGHRCYTTRVYGFSIDKSDVRLRLGGFKNESSADDPWYYSWHWSWKDALCGKGVFAEEKGEPQPITIHMPEGSYPAIATPEHRTWTFKRFRKPIVRDEIDIRVEGGIPNGREKYGDWDSTWGFGFNQSAIGRVQPHEPGWDTLVSIAATQQMLQERARYADADWIPPVEAMNPRMVAPGGAR